jgi:hypothetical protein
MGDLITKQELDAAVKALAKKHRSTAVAILERFGVLTTASLKPEDIAPAHTALVEALARLEGAP